MTDRQKSISFLPALLLNQSLPANDILQQNRKTVNRIFLETLAQGVESLSEAQYEQALLIAQQCPAVGGASVYQARVLCQLHSTMSFDNETLCVDGEERNKQVLRPVQKAELSVFPNPANNEVFIRINQADLNIQLLDLNGRLIWNNIPGTQEYRINTAKLPSGLYICRVSGEGSVPPVKLVIQH